MATEAYAVVMAGGSGTRLWPMSTKERPKQILALNGRSLIQQTVDRLAPLFPLERIWIVTIRGQKGLIQGQLPEVPLQNIIEEPLGRNTALCIGLAAIYLKQIDPAAVMVALPADHFIEDDRCFCHALNLGIQIAKEGYLVTLGIEPDYPETGYGYIEAGESISKSREGLEAKRVKRMIEKPSLTQARRFLKKANVYWNSGIFIWKVERILEELETHMPKLSSCLRGIEVYWGTTQLDEVITSAYNKQEPVSIDRGVMEKASQSAVIPVMMGWNDLGDWNAFVSVLGEDEEGNVIRAKHIGIELENSVVFSLQDRLIATIGLENVVIVDTPEALLVMDRSRAQQVKELVARVEGD